MGTLTIRIRYSDLRKIRNIFKGEYGETAAHYFMRLAKFLKNKRQTEEVW